MQPVDGRRRQRGEHGVGLHRVGEVDPRDGGDGIGEPPGHGVGVPGGLSPEVSLEQAEQLGRDEAHLGGQLRALLARVQVVGGELRAEEDGGLGSEEAALGPSEGQDVDAAVRGELAQLETQSLRGVHQPGAVHVQEQPGLVRGLRQRRDLGGRVHGPQLGGLGDGHDPGLHVVLVAEPDEPGLQQFRRELAVRRRHVDELGAGDALRRPALVDVDVRRLRADHRLERPQHGREDGHVAAGPVEDGERLHVAQELAQTVAQALGPEVVSVGSSPAVVGGGDRREDGGVRPRVVVAGEEREWSVCAVHDATFFLMSDS